MTLFFSFHFYVFNHQSFGLCTSSDWKCYEVTRITAKTCTSTSFLFYVEERLLAFYSYKFLTNSFISYLDEEKVYLITLFPQYRWTFLFYEGNWIVTSLMWIVKSASEDLYFVSSTDPPTRKFWLETTSFFQSYLDSKIYFFISILSLKFK